MTDSILNSTKQILGLAPDYTAFDLDVMTHINSAFLDLTQIGVGPETGFLIEDADGEWWDLLGDDPRLNAVKTYVYLKVRMIFDPPQTSFHLESMKTQLNELLWRLSIQADPAPIAATTVDTTLIV